MIRQLEKSPYLNVKEESAAFVPADSDQPVPLTSTITEEKLNIHEKTKYLYDTDDFLNVLVNIRNPNIRNSVADTHLGLMKTKLRAPLVSELANRFRDMSPLNGHVGLDESVHDYKTLFNYHEEAEAVLTVGTIADARKLLRHGVVSSVRPRLWRLACGYDACTTSNDREKMLFHNYREKCDKFDSIIDEVFMLDVQSVTDDPRYFIFEVGLPCSHSFMKLMIT